MIVQLRSTTSMPREAHPKRSTPSESLITVRIKASSITSSTLVGVFIDASPSPINSRIACWFVAAVSACGLEHRWLVEDSLVICRIELHKERFPLFDEL